MLVRLIRKVTFSSGHRYWLHQLDEHENKRLFGKWASPYNHGHNYVLEAGFEGEIDPETGMAINIKVLDEMLEGTIVEQFDQKSINDEVGHFIDRAPTLENLLLYIRDELAKLDYGCRKSKGRPDEVGSQSDCQTPVLVRLVSLRLIETPELWSEWSIEKGNELMTLTRTYEFAASHRLYAEALPEGRNLELYGKCANPAGHGHNYKLEVTVAGEIDTQTGMMVDLGELDETVLRLVVDRYDHHNLNQDIPEFEGKVTTSEVVANGIWDALNGKLPARLARIRLFETERSWFEISA